MLKKLTISYLVFCFLLTQGCATLISGSKQNIHFSSNVDGAEIYEGSNLLGKAPLKTRIARKGTHNITIKKEGYKSEEIEMKATKGNGLTWLSYWVMPVFFPLGLIGVLNMDGGLSPLAIPELVIGLLGPPLMLAVDGITGASKKYADSDLSFYLLKTPPKVSTDSSKVLLTQSVNFNIDPGTIIGKEIVNGGDASNIKWESTSNLKDNDIANIINNELKKAGYKVSGLEDNAEKQPQLIIKAEVKEINMNMKSTHLVGLMNPNGTIIREPYSSVDKGECTVPVIWKFVKASTGETIYSTTTTGKSIKYKTSFQQTVYDAISSALYDLLDNKEATSKLLTQSSSSSPVSNLLSSGLISINKPSDPDKKSKTEDLLKKATEAVITIETDEGHGSGFIISSDGYAITNQHVVKKSKTVNVNFSNGFTLVAEVVRVSESEDLALLKIKGSGFTSLSIGNSDNVKLSTDVYAIGSPHDKSLGQTISKGIISGIRKIEDRILIQTDAKVSPGNSGGPLINLNGEVIGVVQSKIIDKGVEGISFCIPSNEIFDNLFLVYK